MEQTCKRFDYTVATGITDKESDGHNLYDWDMRALGFDDSDDDDEASVSSVQVVHPHIKSYLDFNRLRFVPDDHGTHTRL